HGADRLHRILAADGDRHDGAAGEIADHALEKALATVLGIMLLHRLPLRLNQLQPRNPKTPRLDPASDLADEVPLNAPRLDKNKCRFHNSQAIGYRATHPGIKGRQVIT